jgi:hypothetical protein
VAAHLDPPAAHGADFGRRRGSGLIDSNDIPVSLR